MHSGKGVMCTEGPLLPPHIGSVAVSILRLIAFRPKRPLLLGKVLLTLLVHDCPCKSSPQKHRGLSLSVSLDSVIQGLKWCLAVSPLYSHPGLSCHSHQFLGDSEPLLVYQKGRAYP